MTMIIAANLGEYVVLAADKRAVMLGADGLSSYVVSDDTKKIVDCKCFGVTGMGYVEILDDFKSMVCKAKMNSTDIFISLAKKAYFKNFTTHNYKLSKTKYLVAYITELNNFLLPRVAIIEAGNPNDLIIVDDITILCKVTKGTNETLRDFLKENLKVPDEKIASEQKLIFENIEYNKNLILKIFKTVSRLDNSVSSSMDFFVLTKNFGSVLIENCT
ncbi:hypothetical protein [Gilliamella sp. HK7]|jgi:hypothetical protein|uniref:hypothetical protein n=3 Tax=unclassified Gilliamella TaxID=2685620 RepID=UPI00080E75AE|nr:hypothetical protein [Gilliamella apicola]OCG24175.1 hypothetical protein A9G46_08895 [Gilliamella apicola]